MAHPTESRDKLKEDMAMYPELAPDAFWMASKQFNYPGISS
jgi:hypothetical protein